MSSENCVRIVMAENLRFPGVGSSAPGKPGAKARPKGVADAQTVEIPSPYELKHADTNADSEPGAGRPGRKGLKSSREEEKAGGEKRHAYVVVRPYRKPTQVDEERILRPSGEGLLRNSAY